MRQYKFELIINEVSDELFWEGLMPFETGIEDIRANIKNLLHNGGFPMDPDSDNKLILKEFKLTDVE